MASTLYIAYSSRPHALQSVILCVCFFFFFFSEIQYGFKCYELTDGVTFSCFNRYLYSQNRKPALRLTRGSPDEAGRKKWEVVSSGLCALRPLPHLIGKGSQFGRCLMWTGQSIGEAVRRENITPFLQQIGAYACLLQYMPSLSYWRKYFLSRTNVQLALIWRTILAGHQNVSPLDLLAYCSSISVTHFKNHALIENTDAAVEKCEKNCPQSLHGLRGGQPSLAHLGGCFDQRRLHSAGATVMTPPKLLLLHRWHTVPRFRRLETSGASWN